MSLLPFPSPISARYAAKVAVGARKSVPPSLVPRLSINVGEDSRARHQTYAHVLDIAAFIPPVTVRSMANDVFYRRLLYWEDVI